MLIIFAPKGSKWKIDNRVHVKYKIDYLKLVLKISKICYKGDEPPKELLQHACEASRLAGASEEELKIFINISRLSQCMAYTL